MGLAEGAIATATTKGAAMNIPDETDGLKGVHSGLIAMLWRYEHLRKEFRLVSVNTETLPKASKRKPRSRRCPWLMVARQPRRNLLQ